MDWNISFTSLVSLFENCSTIDYDRTNNCSTIFLEYQEREASSGTGHVGVFAANQSITWPTSVDISGENSTAMDYLNQVNVVGAIVIGLILGVIILLVIIGNVLVLLAVFVNPNLRTTTNLFIISLASADLLLGTAVLPFSASLEIINVWVFGETICEIWACIDVLCCTASILSLCAISIDRYIGVTKPLRHSTIMTEKRTILFIVFIWFLSAVIGIGPLIGWKERPIDPDPYECTVNKQVGYVLFSVAGSFYIPATIIIVVYLRIYQAAARQSRSIARGYIMTDKESRPLTMRVHSGGTKNKIKTKNGKSIAFQSDDSDVTVKKIHTRVTLSSRIAKFNREKKAAKTLGIVVGVFLLCWFPFFFFLPLETLCPTCVIPELLFKIIFWLGYCNSLINPFIYACNSREFKRAFRQILSCRFKRRRRNLKGLQGDNRRRTASLFSQTRSSVVSGVGRSTSETDKILQVANRYQSNSSIPGSHLRKMSTQTSFALETLHWKSNCKQSLQDCVSPNQSPSHSFTSSDTQTIEREDISDHVIEIPEEHVSLDAVSSETMDDLDVDLNSNTLSDRRPSAKSVLSEDDNLDNNEVVR